MDILLLWSIHHEVAGSGQTRQRRVDVLNRAAFVLIAACWESYIEDVAIEAFDHMLAVVQTPATIPARIKVIASRQLREDKDERKVWELAGDGWRTVLREHRDVVVSRWLKDFNTPKADQVCALMSGLLGLPAVSSHWHWDGMAAQSASTALDDYMTIRGNIAHRIRHVDTVHKSWAKRFLSHVRRLVETTDEAVHEHMSKLSRVAPW